MSVTAVTEVLEHSKAKGNARMVLTVLAEAVNEDQVKAGLPWEAWPCRSTMARKANCTAQGVKKALRSLRELGEIVDTGKKIGKGVRVYRLTVGATEVPPSEGLACRVAAPAGDVGGNKTTPLGGNEITPWGQQNHALGATEVPPEPEGNRTQEPDTREPDTATRAGARESAAVAKFTDDELEEAEELQSASAHLTPRQHEILEAAWEREQQRRTEQVREVVSC